MKKYFNIIGSLMLMLLFLGSCQNLDRPALGDYPKDANPPGGPLSFYTAFDGTSDNPLMNAVDSIRAKFPLDNPLQSIDGVNGKAIQGENYKFIKYSSANDFAQKAGSFTISVWAKKGSIKTDHIFSLPTKPSYHWSAGSMFLLTEGSVASPTIKFFVKDATGEMWFQWLGADSPHGLYDGNWHHLAFVYDGSTSTMTFYLDGVAQSLKPEWTNHGEVQLEPDEITGLKIGAGPQDFTPQEIENGADNWLKNSWDGGIDQFRMYTKALSASEIEALFTNKK